jgi:hypothetical protein
VNTVHCLEACMVAAAILEFGKYPPIIISFESQDYLDHVIFVFKGRNGRFGSISRSRDFGLHGRKPVFKTYEALARSYIDPYVDRTGRVTGYAVANLNDLSKNWRDSEKNLWTIENKLADMPHKKINCSSKHYKKLLARFNAGYLPEFHDSWI